MRTIAACLVFATGCTAVFGLDEPVHRGADDAAVIDAAVVDTPAINVDAPPIDSAPPDASSAQCPAGFVTINGSASKFLLVNNNIAWAAAEADCESRGAGTHLAVIDDESQRLLADAATPGATWIGLTDIVTEGTFQWVTDQDLQGYPGATSPPWNIPPQTDVNRNCVQILSSGQFSDVSCTVNRPYICECDGYDADPTNY